MFRNYYDNDVTTWSPQGRIYQVEYATEAVDLGTASVGLKSPDYAVILGLFKPTTDLGLSQPKIITICEHVGICTAGITGDARMLGRYLRSECLSYRHTYDACYPISRLVTNLGNKMQISTQRYDRRPMGVGLLLAGFDEKGSHLYKLMPSANVFNCKAMAIGNRSQGACTYLQNYVQDFPYCTKDELICHGIQAISFTTSFDNPMKLCIGVVGKNHPFKILSEEESTSYQRTCKGPDDSYYQNYSWYPEELREFNSEFDDLGSNSHQDPPTNHDNSERDLTPETSNHQM